MARFIFFINSSNKYLLNTSPVPGTVLGARIQRKHEKWGLKPQGLDVEDGSDTRKQTRKHWVDRAVGGDPWQHLP